MKDSKLRYTLRLDPEQLKKIRVVADYYGYSLNRYLERYIKTRIESFEDKHGKIQ